MAECPDLQTIGLIFLGMSVLCVIVMVTVSFIRALYHSIKGAAEKSRESAPLSPLEQRRCWEPRRCGLCGRAPKISFYYKGRKWQVSCEAGTTCPSSTWAAANTPDGALSLWDEMEEKVCEDENDSTVSPSH